MEGGVHRLPEDGLGEVLRVLEVQEVRVGVGVGHDVGPEGPGAHDVGRGVPGVRVGPPDLRVVSVGSSWYDSKKSYLTSLPV